ncbi:MAG TPA: PucR family transcriptional regulator ligand-binding domain-containing protein [Candidatus Nanopelagicales bacterium]|nr:PucR family transcriptional regulator ligand-binding domain-containing protein [Candidatus Nanopelagicales bacterium]
MTEAAPDPLPSRVDDDVPAFHPTVAEVLSLPAVLAGEPTVVAGAAGLAARVRWTHSAEVADVARLLRGGELLLTTGVLLPAADEGLAAYVTDLAAAGAAGLMVETGRRFDRLPPALVDAAQACGLPLVELGAEVRFASIAEQVTARVLDVQLAELRASDQMHQAFTDLTVDGAPPTEVVRQVARMSGRAVVLENLAHQVLAYDAAGNATDEVLAQWEVRSRGVRPDARTGYDPETGWLVTAVGARGQDWGRLVLLSPGGVSARDTVLLERGAATVALSRLVERDRESLERHTHRMLLQDLLAAAAPIADVTLRAQVLGVPLEGRALIAVVLRLTAEPTGPVLVVQERLRDYTENVAAAVRDARGVAVVGAMDDSSVGVLLSLPPRADVDQTLDRLSRSLSQRVASGRALAGADEWVMAVGSVVPAPRDVRRSFLEAMQVADAAPTGTDRSRFYRLPDVRLRGLLHLLREDERVQTYVERELGPLLAHDAAARAGSELTDVLRTYLDAGRNKSAAAAAAHLSRPALYERLQRIERVLGIDLDDIQTCLSLHVALLALDALRRSPT